MRGFQLAAILVSLSFLASCGDPAAATSGGGTGSGAAPSAKSGKPERTADAIAQGKEIYRAQCEKCHGPEGKGDGASRGVALPQPRDFTQKRFKYVTTESRIPSETDLFTRVSEGIAGTQMTAFKETVGEWDRWAVVYFIQDLAQLDPAPKAYPIPPRPAFGDAEKRQANRLYLSSCVKCHGNQGKGDGVGSDTLKDVAGNPIKPRNLADEPLAGGDEPEQVFSRIKLGMAGTPMEPPESYPQLSDKDAWALAEHILALRAKK